MIDGGSDLDLEAAIQNIEEAEVVCLYFPAFNQTLLLDARTTPNVRPLIAVVPTAHSPADRIYSLRRLRPQLARPESITMIPWSRRVASLMDCGVWTALLARLDHVECAEACMKACARWSSPSSATRSSAANTSRSGRARTRRASTTSGVRGRAQGRPTPIPSRRGRGIRRRCGGCAPTPLRNAASR